MRHCGASPIADEVVAAHTLTPELQVRQQVALVSGDHLPKSRHVTCGSTSSYSLRSSAQSAAQPVAQRCRSNQAMAVPLKSGPTEPAHAPRTLPSRTSTSMAGESRASTTRPDQRACHALRRIDASSSIPRSWNTLRGTSQGSTSRYIVIVGSRSRILLLPSSSCVNSAAVVTCSEEAQGTDDMTKARFLHTHHAGTPIVHLTCIVRV